MRKQSIPKPIAWNQKQFNSLSNKHKIEWLGQNHKAIHRHSVFNNQILIDSFGIEQFRNFKTILVNAGTNVDHLTWQARIIITNSYNTYCSRNTQDDA